MKPEVRRIRADEGPQLRALRLRALAGAPLAFGSTLAREEALPEHIWHDRAAAGASSSDRVTFVAEREGHWLGLVTGLAADPDQPGKSEPMLVGMFVESSERGHGVGFQVLEILVHHPATAHFIAAKLVRRFVADDPPPVLVERAAATFRRTDGNIRAVLQTIFTAPEFWSVEAYRAKIKTPLEVVASAARALDGHLTPPGVGVQRLQGGGFALARQVATLGEPLYEAQPPTGYPDRAEVWVNARALLARMNFALGLAHNRWPGTRVDLASFLHGTDPSQPDQVLDRLLAAVLHGQVSLETRAVLLAQLRNPEITRTTADDRVATDTDAEKLAALVLGSPEFQRR